MAMKVKPEVDLTNSVLGPTLYNSQRMEEAVKAAISGVQAPSKFLMEQEPVSKHKTFKHPGRSKPKAKAKPAKAKHVQKKATIPVLVDDEERHALWWDFVKDRSFLSVPYPIRPKDKAEGLKKTLNSQRSKADIQVIKAVGLIPRGHEGRPTNKDWHSGAPVGNVCHEADPAFKLVVDSNSAYIKELSGRYCTNCEIGSALLQLRDRDGAGVSMESQFIDNSIAIHVLEEQLSKPKVKVQFIGPHPEAADRRLAKLVRAEAKVFDIYPDIPSVSSNESVFDAAETQYEKDQWPVMYDQYIEMCTTYKDIDTDLVGYIQWLIEAEAREPVEDTFLTNLKEMAMSDEEIQGRLYLEWLETHTSGAGQNDSRERMEHARRALHPMYEMDLGTYMHPLEQSNPAQYKIMVDNLRVSSNRISRECLQMRTFGEWYVFSTYAAQANPVRRALQEKTHAEIKAFYERQEALAEILIDQALEKQVIPVLTDVVEETTQEELPITDSEVSPIPNDKGTEVVSNVISLQLVKEQRAEGIQKLLNGFNQIDFSRFTPEQEEGARMLIVQLYEALG